MVGLLPWCISLFAKPQHGCKPQKVPAGSVFADQSDTASTVHCGNCTESELFPILLYVLISLVFLHNVNDAHAHVRKFKSWLSWQVGWLSACPLRRWYRWCDCGPAQWGLQLCWTSFFWIIIDVTWCHIVYLSISLSLCVRPLPGWIILAEGAFLRLSASFSCSGGKARNRSHHVMRSSGTRCTAQERWDGWKQLRNGPKRTGLKLVIAAAAMLFEVPSGAADYHDAN